METNKELPTIKEYFEARGHGSSPDVIQSVKNLIELHLSKQAEVMAGLNYITPQSILQASEEYIKNVK